MGFLQRFDKKPFVILAIIVTVGINISTALSSVGQFNQGAGYQAGVYDISAVQPTTFNWTRQSRFNGPQQPFQKWMFQTNGSVQSSPAIGTDGTVYVGSADNKLYAVDANGIQKWAFQTSNFIVDSSPTIGSDGTVYVGSHDGKLYAVNPNGSQKWAFQAGYQIDSSPAIGSDGTVYVGSDKLYAINPNGSQKWAFRTNYINSSPAIGLDGTVYVGSGTSIYALKSSGNKKWIFQTGGHIDSSPAISSIGTIYVGSEDNNLYALNPDGSKKWSFQTGSSIYSSPAIGSDGTIYIGSNKLYAVNSDGTLKWAFPSGTISKSTPVIGLDGTVYVGSIDGKVYAVNPDGSQKWAIQTGSAPYGIETSSPAIGSDGTVYVGLDSSKSLFAIGTDTFVPPTTSISINGIIGNNDWYVSDVSISLSASDEIGGSGIAKIEYSFDNVNWNTYSASLTITTEGPTILYYRATDKAGNVEITKQQVVKVDHTKPTVDISMPKANESVTGILNITGTVADAYLKQAALEYGSGIAPQSWTQLGLFTTQISNGTLAAWDTTKIIDGIYTIRLIGDDEAGNTNTYQINVNVTNVHPPATLFYKYDALNRLIEVTYPSGESTSYSYDAAGNLLKIIKTSP